MSAHELSTGNCIFCGRAQCVESLRKEGRSGSLGKGGGNCSNRPTSGITMFPLWAMEVIEKSGKSWSETPSGGNELECKYWLGGEPEPLREGDLWWHHVEMGDEIWSDNLAGRTMVRSGREIIIFVGVGVNKDEMMYVYPSPLTSELSP